MLCLSACCTGLAHVNSEKWGRGMSPEHELMVVCGPVLSQYKRGQDMLIIEAKTTRNERQMQFPSIEASPILLE